MLKGVSEKISSFAEAVGSFFQKLFHGKEIKPLSGELPDASKTTATVYQKTPKQENLESGGDSKSRTWTIMDIPFTNKKLSFVFTFNPRLFQ